LIEFPGKRDEICDVNIPGMTDETNERRAQALLDYVDAKAADSSPKRIDQRRAHRRPFRARCMVYYPARDGTTVLSTAGKTRDVSPHGIGFLSKKQLIVNTRLRIIVMLDDGREFRLSGVVVRSRNVRDNWYLTGAMLDEQKPGDSSDPTQEA